MTTSRAVRDLLARSGELAVIEAFGARVTADTCIVVAPLVKPNAEVLMTNSAKYAHYGPRVARRGFGVRHHRGVRRIRDRRPCR